jgi:hypothetical protein
MFLETEEHQKCIQISEDEILLELIFQFYLPMWTCFLDDGYYQVKSPFEYHNLVPTLCHIHWSTTHYSLNTDMASNQQT